MITNPEKRHGAPVSSPALKRELIFCAIALSIIILGGWSMLRAHAPYHPVGVADEVSRGGPSGLSTVLTEN